MTRIFPWILAGTHAVLFIWMLASKPFEPYPGPKRDDVLSVSGWHMSTSIMVAGRDLHHDKVGMALFLADFPVVALIAVVSILFGGIMSPMVASYIWAVAWLVGGSLWWFVLARLGLRSILRAG